jgi:hypothetical protein
VSSAFVVVAEVVDTKSPVVVSSLLLVDDTVIDPVVVVVVDGALGARLVVEIVMERVVGAAVVVFPELLVVDVHTGWLSQLPPVLQHMSERSSSLVHSLWPACAHTCDA